MTKVSTAAVLAAVVLSASSLSRAQSGTEGHVNYLQYTSSSFDNFTWSPNSSLISWFTGNISDMIVWSPFFDSRTWWYPNATVYQNLYGIAPGSWAANNHPEWILHDQFGNWLYIPWACGGGRCPQYAGDIANPAFRDWWISNTRSVLSAGNYKSVFIDDTNMEFRVSDGWERQIPPIDSNTGQVMSWDSWRNYVAGFVEQIRGALPNTNIIENAIWFSAPSGTPGDDPYIRRQIASATKINLERGIASDNGLTGGTGFWSVHAFFDFVDKIHAAGKGVNYQEYILDQNGQEYGLASYFMISNGRDSLGDEVTSPNYWFSGYSVDLGPAKGGRSYNNGVYRRDFANGIALLGDPGSGQTNISLPGNFQRLDGSWVSSVSLGSRQGIILRGANGSAPAPAASNPTPAPPTTAPGAGTHYVSDLSPTYVVNGWGTLQVDRSIGGNTLSLNGVKYSKGLGNHAYSEQRFTLGGGCSTFTAMAGIDDETPAGYGSMKFQVWADGALLYDSGIMTGGDAARQVNVDVSGRQSVALVGTNGIYMAPQWSVPNDHGDWADAKLTCSW
jgi:hypothetical protein